MKLKVFSFSLFFFFSLALFSQRYSGNYYGGYSGVYGIQENPATFVHNKPYWDINLIGLGVSGYSQYGYMKDESILSLIGKTKTYNGSDSIPYKYNSATDALFLADSHTGSFVSLAVNTQVALPSFCFKIKDFSFGIFGNSRFYMDAVNTPNFFDYHKLKGLVDLQNYVIPPFNVNTMAWSEIGIHVGKKFELESENSISFGVNVKYLLGHEAGFFENVSDLKFYRNKDSIYSATANTRIGFATGKNLKGNDYTFGVLGTGVGVDFGTEYMVLSEDENSKSLHKYKFGVSVRDLGAITFDKNTQVHKFAFNGLNEIADNIHKNNTNNDDVLKRLSTVLYGDSSASLESRNMTIYLPTSLQLNFDMNVYKSIFVHANISRRLKFFNAQLAAPNVMSISPRFEKRWFEAGMSFSLAEDKWMGIGSYLRLGVLTIGSDHIMSYFFPQSTLRGADIYLSLKFMPLGKKNGYKEDKAERFGSGGNKKEYGCYKYD